MTDDASREPPLPFRPNKVHRNPAVRKGHKGFLPGKSGNPKGRPKGSRNKSTLFRERIDSADEDDIIRQCVTMAKWGDRTAMKICMDRLFPRRRSAPVEFDLPDIETTADVVQAVDAILAAVSTGQLTPDEARTVMQFVMIKGDLCPSFDTPG